jgi:hypothetical protein
MTPVFSVEINVSAMVILQEPFIYKDKSEGEIVKVYQV